MEVPVPRSTRQGLLLQSSCIPAIHGGQMCRCREAQGCARAAIAPATNLQQSNTSPTHPFAALIHLSAVATYQDMLDAIDVPSKVILDTRRMAGYRQARGAARDDSERCALGLGESPYGGWPIEAGRHYADDVRGTGHHGGKGSAGVLQHRLPLGPHLSCSSNARISACAKLCGVLAGVAESRIMPSRSVGIMRVQQG